MTWNLQFGTLIDIKILVICVIKECSGIVFLHFQWRTLQWAEVESKVVWAVFLYSFPLLKKPKEIRIMNHSKQYTDVTPMPLILAWVHGPELLLTALWERSSSSTGPGRSIKESICSILYTPMVFYGGQTAGFYGWPYKYIILMHSISYKKNREALLEVQVSSRGGDSSML